MLAAAEDLDFDAEEKHGHRGVVDLGEADRVLLGGDERIERAAVAPFEEAEDFLFGEAVVVGESLGDFDRGAELVHAFLEAFGSGDTAHGADVTSAQVVEGKFLTGLDILPMARRVVALDDGRGAVEFAQAGEQRFVGCRPAFGHDDIRGAAEVGGGLA